MGNLATLLCAMLVVLLGLNSEWKANACSCQPIHPQDLYCRADFVIKALVVKARMVELGPEGKYRRIHKHKPTDKDRAESSGFSTNVNSKAKEATTVEIINDDDLVRPAPAVGSRHSAPVGPDSRMPGYNPQPAGLKRDRSRIAVYSPGYSKTIGASRRKRGALREILHRRRRVGEAPGALPGVTSPKRRLMLQYRISIVKTFKGLRNFSKKSLDFVYTPPAPLCNVKLSTESTPFILMGTVHEGNLVVNQCDYIVNLSKLTEKERKNAVRNMNFRYHAGCQHCHVKVCNRGGCDNDGPGEPFRCEWKEWWTTHNPRASQFICMQTKHGKCKWYNPLGEDYKIEDIDEMDR